MDRSATTIESYLINKMKGKELFGFASNVPFFNPNTKLNVNTFHDLLEAISNEEQMKYIQHCVALSEFMWGSHKYTLGTNCWKIKIIRNTIRTNHPSFDVPPATTQFGMIWHMLTVIQNNMNKRICTKIKGELGKYIRKRKPDENKVVVIWCFQYSIGSAYLVKDKIVLQGTTLENNMIQMIEKHGLNTLQQWFQQHNQNLDGITHHSDRVSTMKTNANLMLVSFFCNHRYKKMLHLLFFKKIIMFICYVSKYNFLLYNYSIDNGK